MANEISGVALVLPNGRQEVQMIYVFPIASRVKDAQNADVVPAFDPARIPLNLKANLQPAQLTAIASGDAGYVLTNLSKCAGETDAAFLTRARTDYDALTAFYLAQRRDEAVEANNFNQRRFAVAR